MVDIQRKISTMALNIKNAEAEELARQLAAATGESVTRAVAIALRERLDRIRHQDEAAVAERIARIHEVVTGSASRWVEPYRSGDHGELLYDESGLPR